MAISKIGTTSQVYKDILNKEKHIYVNEDDEVVGPGDSIMEDLVLKLITKINELTEKVNELDSR
tara:strand:+ start:9463 stop:9654 length:192 start_codon:yes stop_codon:yes gene_type:complete